MLTERTLTAYEFGTIHLNFNFPVPFIFDAAGTNTDTISVSDDDDYLNDWSNSNWQGQSVPGLARDPNSLVTNNTVPGISTGQILTANWRYDFSYTDPITGQTESVTIIRLYNDSTDARLAYYVSTTPLIDGVQYTLTLSTGNAGIPWNALVCFLKDTKISTPEGNTRIQNLTAGDYVNTLDRGPQKVIWIGKKTVSLCETLVNTKVRPIRIEKDALGENYPSEPLFLSPQHRVYVNSKISQRIFGEPEILVPAVKLIGLPGIRRWAFVDDLEYYHILLNNHEILFSNNAMTESLYCGPQALQSLPYISSSDEVDSFEVPNMKEANHIPIRPFFSDRRKLSKLVERHAKNGKFLVESRLDGVDSTLMTT